MGSSVPPWRSTASAPSATTETYKHSGTSAYTQVQARRTLYHNKKLDGPSQHNQPTEEERPRSKFSPAVRDYVQRCFAPENQVPGVSAIEMQTKLKQIITNAADNQTMDVTDWERLPLPQTMIQNERNQILSNPNISNWPTHSQPASPSNKRKSTEGPEMENNSAPWRTTNNRYRFEERVTHAPTDKKPRMTLDVSSKSQTNLEKRKKRFEEAGGSNENSRTGTPVVEHQGPVVGRCQTLEKNYFRLTSAPNPDTVRPIEVLQKTLELLKQKWKYESNYGYICDQFKSLRQDLTVQHIRNEFTVSVYETHGRIALEKGDLGEYNQCQTQLRLLYAQNLGGHPTEFKAYRILYFLYTRNWTDMNGALADVTAEDKKDPAVKHALDVRSALSLGNYHRFFMLYLDTPNMGAYLMDMFVVRERLTAITTICRAYKPDVNLRFITEELGFESDEQTARFVLDHSSDALLEEKNGTVRLLTGKAGQLFEQAKAEAHRMVDIKGQI
ncbi:hypothetical protein N7495_007035 [Penicillium taxi]|uniref:uncharacterized protein n=1 Tax=Penicillium taxi TaxID=168475 RepID=UPI002545A2A5|nr:uncharacterized protein N7495_007035 [Penicillium taxi]KAJ5895344.1 hypothetical protein N7495_007035 [Penicillium taxi]